jgi:rare lipoprotein A
MVFQWGYCPMRLKNKALLIGSGLALLSASALDAKFHLNPFHHKHKKSAAEEDAAPLPANEPTAEADTPPSVAPTSEAMMQYDEVGYAALGDTDGVSISHPSLPVPCFVEITNLDTGRTILAVVRANASRGRAIASLSPRALALMGAGGRSSFPIRVRRVNPPEQEQAALMSGQRAGDRLDTPEMLLGPLKRKLSATQGRPSVTATPRAPVYVPPRVAPAVQNPEPMPQPRYARPAPEPEPEMQNEPAGAPEPSGRFIVEEGGRAARAAAPVISHKTAPRWSKPVPVTDNQPEPAPAASTGYYIQVVSLSSEGNAQAAARKLGRAAAVVQAGQYYRVRMGPYATEAQARAQLGGLAAKGYGGVKITH